MVTGSVKFAAWASVTLAGLVRAHVSIFHNSMYCFDGPGDNPNNNNIPCHPLYELPKSEYWIHAIDGCKDQPPAPGVYLEIPSPGMLISELANDRAATTWNTDPNRQISDWTNGKDYPSDFGLTGTTCIGTNPSDPNIHTQNRSMAAGTFLALSWNSDYEQVDINNTVIISVRYNTPFKRLVNYDIPAYLPLCPEGGCHAIWGWVADHCGEPNQYFTALRAKVVPQAGWSPRPVGVPKPPVWCRDDPSQCVVGPKQPMVYNQLEGVNIFPEGIEPNGQSSSPGYNAKCGFNDGQQGDIFVDLNSTDILVPPGSTSAALVNGSISSTSDPASTPSAGSGAASLSRGGSNNSSSPTPYRTSTLPSGSSTPSLGSSYAGNGQHVPGNSSLPVLSKPTSSPPTCNKNGGTTTPGAAGSATPSLHQDGHDGSSSSTPTTAPTPPAGSGTPSSSDPEDSLSATSSTPSGSPPTCNRSVQTTSAGAGTTARSKRMKHRRDKNVIF